MSRKKEREDERFARLAFSKHTGMKLEYNPDDPPDYFLTLANGTKYAVEATRVVRKFRTNSNNKYRSTVGIATEEQEFVDELYETLAQKEIVVFCYLNYWNSVEQVNFKNQSLVQQTAHAIEKLYGQSQTGQQPPIKDIIDVDGNYIEIELNNIPNLPESVIVSNSFPVDDGGTKSNILSYTGIAVGHAIEDKRWKCRHLHQPVILLLINDIFAERCHYQEIVAQNTNRDFFHSIYYISPPDHVGRIWGPAFDEGRL